MDLRKLKYFVAVAESRNMGRAAEALHVSQPPLSRHIKSLEDQLGVELFTRTSLGMTLTNAGESLLHDAYNILGLVDQAAERANRAARGQVGTIAVGLYGSGTFGVIPQILNRFRAAHPQVGMSLHYGQTPQQIVALRQERVHIVFERLLPKEDDIETELVAQERLYLAVNENHPLARLKSLPVKALQGLTLRVGSSPAEAAKAVELCRSEGFEPHFSTRISSDVIMATLMTAIGDDVTLVPWSMTNVKVPYVRYLELEECPRSVMMDLWCYHRKGDASPLLKGMLDVVRSYRDEAR